MYVLTKTTLFLASIIEFTHWSYTIFSRYIALAFDLLLLNYSKATWTSPKE